MKIIHVLYRFAQLKNSYVLFYLFIYFIFDFLLLFKQRLCYFVA